MATLLRTRLSSIAIAFWLPAVTCGCANSGPSSDVPSAANVLKGATAPGAETASNASGVFKASFACLSAPADPTSDVRWDVALTLEQISSFTYFQPKYQIAGLKDSL